MTDPAVPDPTDPAQVAAVGPTSPNVADPTATWPAGDKPLTPGPGGKLSGVPADQGTARPQDGPQPEHPTDPSKSGHVGTAPGGAA